MSFRIAEVSDWPVISEISAGSGYDDYINSIGPAYMEDGVIVLSDSERVEGFAKVNFQPDGSAWLSGLRVRPEARRFGIGASLTDYLIDLSLKHGCNEVRMLIEDGNFKSVNLALKKGFSPVSSFRFFDGVPDMSSWTQASGDLPIVVNEGWGFVTLSAKYSGTGKFLERDGNLAYLWSKNTTIAHLIKTNGHIDLAGKGITCIPANDAMGISGKLIPLEGFEAATMYRKSLRD